MQSKTLVIPATYQHLRTAEEAMRTLLLNGQIHETIIGTCELALHELLTNQVDHAYGGNPDAQIAVYVAVEMGEIVMESRDRGTHPDIDLTHVSMPDPSELAEGGYGLAIILALMDEVSYRAENGQNIWRLVKKL